MKTEKIDNNNVQVRETETPAKSVRVSLTGGGGMRLTILATRKGNDTGVTTVTTVDAKKKAMRGMTARYATFDLAVAALRKLEQDAVSKGWKKSERAGGFKARPDSFTTMPVAPKAVSIAPKAGAR